MPRASSLHRLAARRTPPSRAVALLPSFVAAADRVAVGLRMPVAEVRRPAAAVRMPAAVADRMAVAAPCIPAAVAVARAAAANRTVVARGTVSRDFSPAAYERSSSESLHPSPSRKRGSREAARWLPLDSRLRGNDEPR